ncbi:MAG: serine hydrolase domain-containing protein [Robiginitalea sp.]|uniref:serine hydrolase domain-containing protein n=1 Tax=Robiginitalea sp. TaxID=1902411 RepID=UPI003C756B5D
MRKKWPKLLNFLTPAKRSHTGMELTGCDKADALLKQLIARHEVPGLAICASYKGKAWFRGGYGFANLEDNIPVDPERSVFRIASISKPITATALACLVADGTLDLQTDIRTYVPEFPQRHGPVNLKQLAAHTAGIRSYKGKEFALNRPMQIADSLELFVQDPLEFLPGEGYQYSSLDYVLLSLAMERAAGQPFHILVSERVLEPLQMSHTVREVPGEPVENQVEFYTRRGEVFQQSVPVDTRFKLAGGGYLSTVSDICRLGEAYIQGQLIPPALYEAFLTAQQVGGFSTYYGLGWEVSRDARGRSFYGHTGNAIGAYTNFKVFPDQEFVVAILINASTAGVQPILDEVVEALHQSLPAADSMGSAVKS